MPQKPARLAGRMQRVGSRHVRTAPFSSTMTTPVSPCLRFIPLRVSEMAQTPSLQPLEGLADESSVRRRFRQHGDYFIEERLGFESCLGVHNAPLSYLTA
jgi:hypothetical protein